MGGAQADQCMDLIYDISTGGEEGEEEMSFLYDITLVGNCLLEKLVWDITSWYVQGISAADDPPDQNRYEGLIIAKVFDDNKSLKKLLLLYEE